MPPDPAASRTARRAISAMFAANGALMGAWAPQIPLVLTRYDIGKFTLGLLILGLGLGAVGAMLLVGRLIARFGSVAVLRVFALAAAPTLPLMVLAPNLWLLVPAMALFGAIVGSMDVAMNANAIEVERRLGRAIMSASHGFWSLGGFVGGTLGSWLIVRLGAEAQAGLVAAAAAALILTALPFVVGEPPHPDHGPGGQPAPRSHLTRDPLVWLLGAMALFTMMPEGAVLDWAAIYMGDQLQAPPFVAGMAFGLFSGTMAVTRFLGDGLRNRYGAVATLRGSGLVGAAGLMMAALAPVPGLALAGFALAGLGVANMVPILFSAAGNLPGHPPGVAISIVSTLGYAGILVAPSAIGYLAEHSGFRPTYAGLGLVLLVVALLALRAEAADNRAVRPPP